MVKHGRRGLISYFVLTKIEVRASEVIQMGSPASVWMRAGRVTWGAAFREAVAHGLLPNALPRDALPPDDPGTARLRSGYDRCPCVLPQKPYAIGR
jgi:hypothetical protein